jgi:hypothetical protein
MKAETEVAYKYLNGHYALEMLRTLELKITPPNQFNDPFEFTPRVVCTSPEREAKHLLKTKGEMKEMYEEEKALGMFSGNFREYREKIKRMRPALLAGVAKEMPKASARLQRDYLDGISTAVGVLSLSARADSTVMWGHYADRHRGVVIGFDTSWEIFRTGNGLCSVQYSRERLTWDSSWKRGSAAEKAYVERMVRHKNYEWAYERELRQLFQLAGLRRRQLDDGNTGYFLTVPASVVVSVILGSRCPSNVQEEVRRVLREARLSHIAAPKRATLHQTDFAIQLQ